MLETSPNLTQLRLIGALDDRKILGALATKERKRWLCPALNTLYIVYIPSTKKEESLWPALDAVIAARMQEKPLGSVWHNRCGNLVEPDETKQTSG